MLITLVYLIKDHVVFKSWDLYLVFTVCVFRCLGASLPYGKGALALQVYFACNVKTAWRALITRTTEHHRPQQPRCSAVNSVERTFTCKIVYRRFVSGDTLSCDISSGGYPVYESFIHQKYACIDQSV